MSKSPSKLRARKTIDIGELANNHRPVRLNPEQLMRHSAVLAQSGSGKSFMLGRLVEELAIKTKARVLILDPNSDFIRLKEVDSNVWKDPKLIPWFHSDERKKSFSARWAKTSIVIASNRNLDGAKRLVIDWGSLEINEMAAILNIDMNKDSDLYWCLRLAWQICRDTWEETDEENYDFDYFQKQSEKVVKFLQTGQGPRIIRGNPLAQTLRVSAGGQVARRFQALVVGLTQHAIWKSRGDGQVDIRDLIEGEDPARVAVVDLQSLEREEERISIADRLLNALWRRSRQEHWESIRDFALPDQRVPSFVIIDETHNLAPADKDSPAAKKLSAQFVRIAAEGRKYGLYLIVSTQRPRKVDTNVLTECDNLFLMRMTNDSDLDYARQTFGFIKPMTLKLVKSLERGDMLLSGGIGGTTGRVHVSPRRTVQGGKGLSETHWLGL